MKEIADRIKDVIFIDFENETFQKRLAELANFVVGLDLDDETRDTLAQLTSGLTSVVSFLSYVDGMMDGIEKQRRLSS